MKKLLLTIATVVATLSVLSADYMYVIMKNGTAEKYLTEMVDSIAFDEPNVEKITDIDELIEEIARLKEEIATLKADTSSAILKASDLEYYILNDNEVEVVGFVKESAELVIPEKTLIEGKQYTVVSIAEKAFSNQVGIKSASLPKTIKRIGNSAFGGCTSMTDIEIPSGVTTIEKGTFSGCQRLNVLIDNSRYNLDCMYAFAGVGSVKFTGCPLNFTFDENTNTATVVASHLYFLEQTYRDPENIIIPSEIEKDGKVYKVTEIGAGAFWDFFDLKSVEIPSSVTKIGGSAFMACSGLTKINIPSSVTEIEQQAFWACDSLDVMIDNSRYNVRYLNALTGVKSVAFTGCPLNFIVDEENGNAEIASAYNTNEAVSGLTAISIPSEVEIDGKKYNVTSIGEGAFFMFGRLTDVDIPSSITSIGNYAFQSRLGLTNLVISSSVTSIGDAAFDGCKNLDIVIDNSRYNVKSENSSFNGVKSVRYTGSPLLFRISEETNTATVISENENNSNGYMDPIYLGLDSVIIPSNVEVNGKMYSVTSIGKNAFFGCASLASIEIASSITSIEDGAFTFCLTLPNIRIPSSVTSIGINAFNSCENLDIEIDNSKENVEIGDGCFDMVKSVIWLK